jgi:hypothetical protein
MPSAAEEYARLGWLLKNGKIPPEEPCKMVLPRLETKERAEKPQGRTRFVLETDDETVYSRLNLQKNRYMELIVNKAIAVDVLARLWEEPSDQAIKEFCDG